MALQARTPHKQKKWRCPQCGLVRMKPAVYRRYKARTKEII